MSAREKIIVALDVNTYQEASRMVEILGEKVDIFKVGIAPFTSFGERLLEKIASCGKKTFLDLKVHDIPNTARKAAQAAAGKGVFMMNFHCMGGIDMLRAARQGVDAVSGQGCVKPLLLGVTVLTSMDRISLGKIGIGQEINEKVVEFTRSAIEAGFNGVVASAREVKMLKKMFGKDIIVVTPGIRPGGEENADQKRTMTPKEAFSNGADFIVVGRPVIEAEDPLKALSRIIKEAEEISTAA